MFEKWLTRRDATWNELIAALEKFHLTYLADDIRKNFLSRTGNDTYIHIIIPYMCGDTNYLSLIYC